MTVKNHIGWATRKLKKEIDKMKTDYIQELKNGREIVIISADKDSDSAIFYMDRDGKLYSFNRSFGHMSRTDLSLDRLQKHLENMEHENAQIFCRGLR